MSKTYTEVFTGAKLAARDELRTAQVGHRLSKVSAFKREIKEIQDTSRAFAEDLNKRAKRNEVVARDLSQDHPDKADLTQAAIDYRADATVRIAKDATQAAESIATIQKELDIVVAEIASIEAEEGKIKVNREPMIERAKELVTKHFEELFLNGDYDTAASATIAAE